MATLSGRSFWLISRMIKSQMRRVFTRVISSESSDSLSVSIGLFKWWFMDSFYVSEFGFHIVGIISLITYFLSKLVV